jgi:uncharacterized protein YbaA (DUF1428 family)
MRTKKPTKQNLEYLAKYKKMAKASARAWKRAGATQYFEAIGDDVPKGKITSFPKSVKLKAGETVVIGYAFYKSEYIL